MLLWPASFEAQTLESYGFNKVFTPYNQMMLICLYQGLFKYFEINPKTVLTWKRKGILIQEIKKIFEEIPPQNRGHSTLHSFLNIKTLTKVMDDLRLKLVTRAWRRIGGRPLPHWTSLTSRRRLDPSINGIVLIYANSCYHIFIQAHLVIVWLSNFCTTLTRRNATTDFPPYGRVLPGLWIFFSRPTLQFKEYKSGEVRFISRRYSMRLMNKSVWNLNAQGYYNTSSFTMSLLRFFMLLENHVFFLIVF